MRRSTNCTPFLLVLALGWRAPAAARAPRARRRITSPTFAVKTEAHYHAIREMGGLDPGALALTSGAKTSF